MSEQAEEAVQREANYQPIFKVFVRMVVETRSLSAEQRLELLDVYHKVVKELAQELTPQAPNATPWENADDTDSDYFANFTVPAFVHEFGRTKSAAYSYVWSSDRTAVLFDANDKTPFWQQEFFNAEFRERLKASLEKEPLTLSKQEQIHLEFQTDEDKIQISKSSYRLTLLTQVIHILRAARFTSTPSRTSAAKKPTSLS